MPNSQNGWPASPDLRTWAIPGTTRKITLRDGSAGFLLVHLLMRLHERVEAIDTGILDDWGYAYRPVRGQTSGLSNHASGTAVDFNATRHPLGKVDTFARGKDDTIHKLLGRYEGCIRWGGDYSGRKDEMHFEINRPLSGCEGLARRLLNTKRGKQILQANPGAKAVILS